MKPKHYIFLALLVSIILLSFFLGRSCERATYPEIASSDTTRVLSTRYVVSHHDSVVYKPIPYKVTILDTVIIFDSTSFFNMSKQFYSTTEYRDTLKNDSTLFLVLNENISQNKITFRSMDYKTFDKIVTETVTITNTLTPKEKLNMLMFVGMNRNLQTLKNTAFMDFTAYYKRVGIITGFTSDGCVKIGVGLKW